MVKVYDCRRKQPNAKKVKMGFVKSSDELVSTVKEINIITPSDFESVRMEVNNSKRRMNSEY
jgi:hypothetical protein